MPAMIFPPAPNDGDEVTQPNGKTYRYNAAKARWEALTQATILPGLVPIESIVLTNVANAAVLLPSSYAGYIIDIHYCRPLTDSSILALRTSSDGGITYDAGPADYSWMRGGTGVATAVAVGNESTNAIDIISGASNSVQRTIQGRITILGAPLLHWTGVSFVGGFRSANANSFSIETFGQRYEEAIVDAVQIAMLSGNLDIHYTLYGIRGA